MKNRNNVFTATLVALAAVTEAMPRPDGGPTYLAGSRGGARQRPCWGSQA